jgi:ankyrin repeat protein
MSYFKDGLRVNQRNFEGKSPIHMMDGSSEALDILLAAGADFECKDNHGRTLLACIIH